MMALKVLTPVVAMVLAFSVSATAGDTPEQETGIALCKRLTATQSPTLRATVVRGVDGDTVKVSIQGHEISVRMMGIDTPETHYQGKSQGEWGDRAAEVLRGYLPEQSEVTLEFDQDRCDSYGRILAYVFSLGMNVNEQMLRDALAVNFCMFPSTKYCQKFAQIVDRAVSAREGIFGVKGLELPYVWRREISNRPFERPVGNLSSYKVYAPDQMSRVPVAKRIFFDSESDVRLPYVMAAQRGLGRSE
jgi:micrococcal nuclease